MGRRDGEAMYKAKSRVRWGWVGGWEVGSPFVELKTQHYHFMFFVNIDSIFKSFKI